MNAAIVLIGLMLSGHPITAKPHLKFVVDDGWVNIAIWSKDGSRIITFGEGGPAIWDPSTGYMLYRLEGGFGRTGNVCLSPDGKRVLAAGTVKGFSEWEVASGKWLRTYGEDDGEPVSDDIAYSQDGSKVIRDEREDGIHIWDCRTGRRVRTLDEGQRIRDGLQRRIKDLDRQAALTVSPDGRMVVGVTRKEEQFKDDRTIPEPGTVKLWDAKTGKALRSLEGHVADVCYPKFSPNGRYIVATDLDTTKIWSTKTGKLLHDLGSRAEMAIDFQFSPDGVTIAEGSEYGVVTLWDVASGKLLYQLKGHTSRVLSVQFSPDGRRLLSGSKDGTAKIWDVRTGRLLRLMKGFASPDSGQVLGNDETHAVGREIEYKPSGSAMRTHHGSKRPQAVLSGGLLSQWQDYKESFPEIHDSAIDQVLIAPDGKRVLTDSKDGVLKLWDGFSGRLLFNLGEYDDYLYIAFFSADGNRIVTIGTGTRCWDAKTGQLLYRTVEYGDKSWLCISGDGHYDSSEGVHPRHGYFVLRTPTTAKGIPFAQVLGKSRYVPHLADRINTRTYKFNWKYKMSL